MYVCSNCHNNKVKSHKYTYVIYKHFFTLYNASSIHRKRTCNICNSTFESQKELNDHIILVHRNENLKCDNCDTVFQSNVGLGPHKESCHETKKESKLQLAQIKEEIVFEDIPKDLVCF